MNPVSFLEKIIFGLGFLASFLLKPVFTPRWRTGRALIPHRDPKLIEKDT